MLIKKILAFKFTRSFTPSQDRAIFLHPEPHKFNPSQLILFL